MVLNLTHRAFKFTLLQHLDHQEVSLATKSFTLCTSEVKSNQARKGGVHEVLRFANELAGLLATPVRTFRRLSGGKEIAAVLRRDGEKCVGGGEHGSQCVAPDVRHHSVH